MTPTDVIGDATLYRGDCLDVLRALPEGSVDAVVTDPPYGTLKTEWDHSIDGEVFTQSIRVSRSYCVFFYSNTRLWHILSELHALGADAWVIPWHKPNAVGFERRFAPQWVPVVCAYRPGVRFWGQDFVSHPITPQDIDHPTPKPLKVVRWLVERASAEGGLVLDPFMGSGTTGVACLQTGRRFIGVELDPTHYETARQRIAHANGEGSLFAPTTRRQPTLTGEDS